MPECLGEMVEKVSLDRVAAVAIIQIEFQQLCDHVWFCYSGEVEKCAGDVKARVSKM